MPTSTHPSLSDDLARVEHELRTSLLELATSAKADPTKPQKLSRDLRLNRGLAWKMARIVQGKERGDFIHHVPGSAGIEILLDTMRRGGASPEATDRARAAFEEFHRIMLLHAGDRHTLEVMASQLSGRPVDSSRLIDQRRLAFQGNCGILGVRARTQASVHVAAPNAEDPTWLDMLRFSGYVDLNRVRHGVRWLLFRQLAYHDDGTARAMHLEPVDQEFAKETGVPLVRPFCSPNLPALERTNEGSDICVDLPPGPVGNTANMTCFLGTYSRRAARAHRDARDTRAELAMANRTPAEHLLFDVFLHERLAKQMSFEVGVYSMMDGRPLGHDNERQRNRLPTTEAIQPLGNGIDGAHTPHVENYDQVLEYLFRRGGWNPSEFVGYRVELEFPPIPSAVIFSAPLPGAPA